MIVSCWYIFFGSLYGMKLKKQGIKMKPFRKVQIMILFKFVVLSQIVMSGPKENKQIINTSDPEAVARAFIVSLAEKNVNEAVKYVIPEEREEIKKLLKKQIPPLPKEPKLSVIVKKNGVQADVKILNGIKQNPPMGLDMEFKNGKWWIVK